MTNEEGQKRLEAHVEKTLYENNVVQKDSLNGLMRGKLQDALMKTCS